MKILIVDDHAIVRRGIRQILSDGFPDAEFGEASDAQEALDSVLKQDWSVVVLDVTMPGRSGLDALKEVKAARPKVPVVMLSMHSEDQFALRALRAGAAAYLTKDSVPEQLVAVLRKALAGGKYVSPTIAEKLASNVAADTEKPRHQLLSDREFEVLRLIGSGKTVKEIAGQLSLSVKTISTYRTRVLEKMGLKTNAQLTTYAVQNKLVD